MNTLRRITRTLSTLNEKLAVGFKLLSWTFLLSMMVFIVLQVICRYGLNSSLDWPEDVSLMMMIWVAFAVAPIAYRSGANVALDTFARMLPGRAHFGLYLLIHILVLLTLLALMNESFGLIERTRIRANSIPISMKYVYAIMPVGFGATILVVVELGLRCVIGLVCPADSAARAPAGSNVDPVQQA